MAAVPDRSLAYLVLRLAMGVDMAMHGVNRLVGGVDVFAAKMAKDFAATPLPAGWVTGFLTVLPFVELLLGLAILVGALLRPALFVGGLLIVALIFGTALKGDWTTVGVQLLYSLIYYLLLSRREDDVYGVDAWRRRTSTSRAT